MVTGEIKEPNCYSTPDGLLHTSPNLMAKLDKAALDRGRTDRISLTLDLALTYDLDLL